MQPSSSGFRSEMFFSPRWVAGHGMAFDLGLYLIAEHTLDQGKLFQRILEVER